MTDEKNWRERLRPPEWTVADEEKYIQKKLYELERQISANDKALLGYLDHKHNTLCDVINEIDARCKKEGKMNKLYWMLLMFGLFVGSFIKLLMS